MGSYTNCIRKSNPIGCKSSGDDRTGTVASFLIITINSGTEWKWETRRELLAHLTSIRGEFRVEKKTKVKDTDFGKLLYDNSQGATSSTERRLKYECQSGWQQETWREDTWIVYFLVAVDLKEWKRFLFSYSKNYPILQVIINKFITGGNLQE